MVKLLEYHYKLYTEAFEKHILSSQVYPLTEKIDANKFLFKINEEPLNKSKYQPYHWFSKDIQSFLYNSKQRNILYCTHTPKINTPLIGESWSYNRVYWPEKESTISLVDESSIIIADAPTMKMALLAVTIGLVKVYLVKSEPLSFGGVGEDFTKFVDIADYMDPITFPFFVEYINLCHCVHDIVRSSTIPDLELYNILREQDQLLCWLSYQTKLSELITDERVINGLWNLSKMPNGPLTHNMVVESFFPDKKSYFF